MINRWTILALLFLVRAAMGLQFQTVPALVPLFERDLGLAIADIGILIGLFHLPGIALALPGGAIGARFGEKSVVLLGLALMAFGGAVMVFVPGWPAQLGGRLMTGVGGVLLNVCMTKMVTDWFAGREIATAMAIFANAWPAGIALALLALPPIGAASGLSVALLTAAGYSLAGLALLGLVYRPPADAAPAGERGQSPKGAVLAAVLVAGLIWGFYNLAFSMIFAFGPKLLIERGWSLVGSGQTAGLVMALAMVSVVGGGILADRTGRPGTVIVAGTLMLAAMMAFCARSSEATLFLGLGLLSGLPAGAILSLPSRVLAPSTRAIGMGLFFTMFYLAVGLGPMLAGYLAATSGTIATTFEFAVVLLLACPLLLAAFQVLRRQAIAAGS
jgi:cyanate permease